ncbi:MAG: redoxin domain-containing protein [Acidobacteriota bacterium]
MLVATSLLAQASHADNDALRSATDGEALEIALCHVCRVHDGESEAEEVLATAVYEGTTYGFCSVACRDRFLATPTGYVPPVLPRPAPAFEVVDLDGAPFHSDKLDGRWVLIDFWATWCPPCIRDLPKLTKLHERYAERGFVVIGISIDEGDDAVDKVERMVERRRARHPIYLDLGKTPAWAAYQVPAVPMQFLVSPDGEIVAQWSGAIDLKTLETEIKSRLGADG